MCVCKRVGLGPSFSSAASGHSSDSFFLPLSLPPSGVFQQHHPFMRRSPYSIIYPERSSPLRESSFSLYFPSLSKRMLSCLLFTALVLLLLPLLAIDSFCPSVDLFLVAK